MSRSKYIRLLSNLYEGCEAIATEMPSVARMMRLIGLAAEAMEVKNFFETDVLPKTEKMAVLDVDIDVDYMDWANKVWPNMSSVKKEGLYTEPEKYFKEDEDKTLPSNYEDRLLRYFPDADNTPQAFNAHEQLRTIVAVAKSGTLMSEEHLVQTINKILNDLKIILYQIHNNIQGKKTEEQYINLYESEQARYSLTPTVVFAAKKDYEKWEEEKCYNDPDIDKLEDYRIECLLELFNSQIFLSDVESSIRTHRIENEIDFDSIDNSDKVNFAWKNYAKLRDFYSFEDGLLTLKDKRKVGHFFYLHRKDEGALQKREAFFKFYFKLNFIQNKLTQLRHPEELTNKNGEELNYFAPKRNIEELICQGWFDEVSTDKKKYTVEWRKNMLEALMKSEHKDDIATQWMGKNKALSVKCAFVGALKDAGVIKGSYNKLATLLQIKEEVLNATPAKYMGKGKNQAYYDWLLEYVKS